MGGRWLEFAWSAVRVFILAYGGYLLLVFVLQRSVVFPGTTRVPDRGSGDVPAGVEQIWLETSHGRVEAWLLDAGPATPVALFAHGNGELIDDWLEPMEMLREAGLSMLLVEYPGYGHSAGRPSRSSIREAFAAAFDAAEARRGGSAPILGMGRSLGGGAVADLAEVRALDALILMSTLSSAAEVAWRSFRVPGWLVRDDFDVRSAVAGFGGPVLLLHGTRDEILPFEHATRIAADRPDIHTVPLDCGHNDCLRVWPETTEAIRRFLASENILPEG